MPGTTTGNNPFRSASALSAFLTQTWWTIALRGVVATILLVASFSSDAAFPLLMVVFPAYLLATGTLSIVPGILASIRHRHWEMSMDRGVLNILSGIIAFTMPGATLGLFTALASLWTAGTGILMIMTTFDLSRTEGGRTWLMIGGIVSVAFGLALQFARIASPMAPAWWFGAFGLTSVITLFAFFFKLKQVRDELAGTDPSHGQE